MRKQIFFVVFLCLGIWGMVFAAGEVTNSPNVLKGMSKTVENGHLVIQLEGSEPFVNYTFYDYPPDKFVIDIPNLDASSVPQKMDVNSKEVSQIKLESISNSKESSLIQVEVFKDSLSKCLVSAEGNNLLIKVISEGVSLEEKKPQDIIKPTKVTETSSNYEPKVQTEKAKILKSIEVTEDGKSVTIKADGSVDYKYFALKNPERMVVDFKGISKNLAPSKIEGKGIISQIRTNLFKSDPEVMRVVLDLQQEANFRVFKTDDGAVVTADESFNPSKIEAKNSAVKNESLPQMAEVRPSIELSSNNNQTIVAEKKSAEFPAVTEINDSKTLEDISVELKPLHSNPSSEFKNYDDLFVAQDSSAKSEAKSAPAPVVPLSFKEKTISGGEVQYTGQPISLSLKDADIKDVLRLFHDVSKLNIVVHPSVTGKVTIDLENVPWDQAMDIVLKNNGLDYIYENNVIWVASSSEISRKFADKQRLEEDKLNSEPPVTFTKRLSYAKAQTMKSILDKFLSSKGDIYTDDRTNSVIIKEVPSRKDGIVKLLETLDFATQQVLIEARIVESTVSWRSQFGISWGGGTATSSNNFPNNQTGFPNWMTGDFAINVPPPASNGYIDLVFGNLAGTFNLDVRLSALENTGRGRVISAPKVMTQDNEKASIESGRQIPVPIATADKVSVMYVNATLKLDVTPHITADGNITMDVDITNDAVDFQNQQAGTPPPIFKKQAKTVLKVRDGQTVVIGGIFVTSEGISQQGLPFLSKIPVLGWLFKNRTKNRDNSELLIFLTPKIIR